MSKMCSFYTESSRSIYSRLVWYNNSKSALLSLVKDDSWMFCFRVAESVKSVTSLLNHDHK